MGDPLLARLRLGGVPVADYADGSALDPALVPRPYLHPVRTLGGVVVTDARPPDHPWHLGLGVAVPDVGGANFWGGPTYVCGTGYVAREDHGRIVHTGFDELDDAGFVERLHWLAPHGATESCTACSPAESAVRTRTSPARGSRQKSPP